MKGAFRVAVFVGLAAAPVTRAENTGDPDLRNAVPLSQAGKLPRIEDRYHSLENQIETARPGVDTARERSAALGAQAKALQQKLVAAAARVQALQQEQQQLNSQIAGLSGQERTFSTLFAKDRLRLAHLLAVLERLQSDFPPPIAIQPADALASSRGAMLVGAGLPRIYAAAAELSRRVHDLRHLRSRLAARRLVAAKNAASLSAAQSQMDRLLATKEREAGGAKARYAVLQERFDAVAREASSLKRLLDRISALRRTEFQSGGLTPMSTDLSKAGGLQNPALGQVLPNSDKRWPGLSFLTAPGASVVAPADSHVLFAGPYHTSGQILILEAAGGYDLVLAGLDRLDVHPGDELLAGEPVGTMPHGKGGSTLYFELRKAGRSLSPAAWLGTDPGKAKKQ